MALADSIAGALKADDRADYAIVLSHIGYRPGKAGLPSDSVMALSSSNIDLILGGHSHTSINPATGNHQYVYKQGWQKCSGSSKQKRMPHYNKNNHRPRRLAEAACLRTAAYRLPLRRPS